MRKFVIFTLIALMFLSPSLYAENSAKGSFDYYPFEEGQYISFIESWGDKILAVGESLYEIDINKGEINNLARIEFSKQGLSSSMDCVLLYEDELLGINVFNKTITVLRIVDGLLTEGELFANIDYEGSPDWELLTKAFIQDDVLYYTNRDTTNDLAKHKLYAFSLKNRTLKVDSSLDFAFARKYKEDKLLTGYRKNAAFDYSDIVVGEFDVNSSSFKELATIKKQTSWNAQNVFYNSRRDRIYFVEDSTIKQINKDGTFTTVAYVPQDHSLSSAVELVDGRIAFVVYENTNFIAIRNLDENELPKRSLTILGSYGGEIRQAVRLMEGVPILLKDYDFTGSKDIAENIIKFQDSFDIIQVDPKSVNVEELIKNGYIAPIENEYIIEKISGMAEHLTDEISYDGKLYGLPLINVLQSYMYDSAGFTKLGLKAPESLYELLEQYHEFYTKPLNEYSDYEYTPNRYNFTSANRITQFYAYSKALKGEKLVFDTDEFKALLSQVRKNAQEVKENKIDWDDEVSLNNYYEKSELVRLESFADAGALNYLFQINVRNMSWKPLKIGIEKGDDSFITAGSNYFLINAKSKNIDLALEFMKHYIDTMDRLNLLGLNMSFEDGIKNPSFEKEKANIELEIEKINERLESLAGHEKQQYLEDNMYLLKNKSSIIDSFKYLVSPQAAHLYTDIINQNIVLEDYNNSLIYDDRIIPYELIDKFDEGLISEDEFAKELDRAIEKYNEQ